MKTIIILAALAMFGGCRAAEVKIDHKPSGFHVCLRLESDGVSHARK